MQWGTLPENHCWGHRSGTLLYNQYIKPTQGIHEWCCVLECMVLSVSSPEDIIGTNVTEFAQLQSLFRLPSAYVS